MLKKHFILAVVALAPSLLPAFTDIESYNDNQYDLNSDELPVLKNERFSYWADELDEATVLDGWATYKNYYEIQSTYLLSRDEFLVRIQQAAMQDLTSEDFLELNIENHRLDRFFNAKQPEEAYPIDDRPRGIEDVESVKYFMNPSFPVSPILVAIIQDIDENIRKIKLDGVHRLMAAHICRYPIRVVWVDLTPGKCH
jgi:hypothetical protein